VRPSRAGVAARPLAHLQAGATPDGQAATLLNDFHHINVTLRSSTSPCATCHLLIQDSLERQVIQKEYPHHERVPL
jgi:hypothetical protein